MDKHNAGVRDAVNDASACECSSIEIKCKTVDFLKLGLSFMVNLVFL